MCSLCNGTGIYYTETFVGMKVHPCTCNHCMQDGQAAEQRFELFLNRLNDQYIQSFGKPAPSWVAYQNKIQYMEVK